MAARRLQVRKADLQTATAWMDERALKPVALTALPGGGLTFLFVLPVGAEASPETEEERAAWDAALR